MRKRRSFSILRKWDKPKSSQRQLAKELGFSLGKLNYCLKELKKGLLKIENFQNNEKLNTFNMLLRPKVSQKELS